MQFPYFSGDKGGSLLESLLREPQDVLRKKSAQSCTRAFRARGVDEWQAFTSLPPLCRRPRGFSLQHRVASPTQDAVTLLHQATGFAVGNQAAMADANQIRNLGAESNTGWQETGAV